MPKPYDHYTRCRDPWTEIGLLKCFYLHSCIEGSPARATNVWALQDWTALHPVTGIQRHVTFEIKSHDYSFTYQKQGSNFLHQFWCGSVRLHEEISFKFKHKNISFTDAQRIVYIIPLLWEKVPHLWRQSHQFPWLPGFHQQMATARYMELTLTSFPWLPGLRGYDRICLWIFTKNVVINELLNKWRHICLFCFVRRVIIN